MLWCLAQLRYHQFAYLDLGPKNRMQKLDWKNLEDERKTWSWCNSSAATTFCTNRGVRTSGIADHPGSWHDSATSKSMPHGACFDSLQLLLKCYPPAAAGKFIKPPNQALPMQLLHKQAGKNHRCWESVLLHRISLQCPWTIAKNKKGKGESTLPPHWKLVTCNNLGTDDSNHQAVTCSKDHTPVYEPAHARWHARWPQKHYSKPPWVVSSACLSKLWFKPAEFRKQISPRSSKVLSKCFQSAATQIYRPCGTCRFMRTSSLVLS